MNATDISAIPSSSLGGKIVKGLTYLVFGTVVVFAIVLVAKNRCMPLPSKVLLGNLMIAHLGYWLTGFVRLFIVEYIKGMDCMAMIYPVVTQLYGTIFAITAVAADRFMATRFPFQYVEVKCRYIISIVIFLWVVASLFSFATFYGGVDETNACSPWFTISTLGLILFDVTVTFSIIAVLGMCFYVGKEVLRHIRSIHATTLVLESRNQQHLIRVMLKQLDTTVTFGLIALSHCLMVLPLTIIFPLMSLGRYDETTMILLMVVFGTCSRVSDPFIFILRSKIKRSSCCVCLPSVPTISYSGYQDYQNNSTRVTVTPVDA